jgi:hypothetical protein
MGAKSNQKSKCKKQKLTGINIAEKGGRSI